MYDIDNKNFDDKSELRKENNLIFNLDIDGFNGPLDLLLQLAQTKKLDVTKISILELVDQYLGFIKKVKELDLHIASDYLVMAAILAYIKSKMLLPDQDEGNKDIPPLPEILEFNLKRLNAMRKCADSFSKRKLLNETRFLKGQILDQSIVLETEYYCSSKNLIICFANIFNRKSSKTINLITKNYYSIENAIERIRELYNSYKDWTPINTFFPKFSGTQIFKNEFKIAMISTISASLELAKQGEVNLKQEKEFGEILLKKRK